MAKDRGPAFQFYASDWLGSTKITLMTPAQEGAYIRLLAHAWNSDDCGLPNDDAKLAVLSRLGEGWLKGGSEVLRECFIEKNGRIYNERLLNVWEEQKAWIEKSRAGGVRSGKVRRAKRLALAKGGCEMVATKREPKGNTPSPSPSPFSNKEQPLAVVFGCEFFSVDEKQHKAFSEAFPLVDLVTIYPVISSWFVTNPDDPDKPSKLTRIARVRIWIEKKQKELEQEIAKKNEINKPKMIW